MYFLFYFKQYLFTPLIGLILFALLAPTLQASVETVETASLKLQPINGSRVQLDIPKDFVQEDGFIGIRHHREHSSIVISEVPSSYIEFSKQYEDDKLAKKGMEVKRRQRIENDGLSGQRIIVEYNSRGEKYIRHLLITGDARESVIIAGYYPKRLRRSLESKITDTLDTAFWDSSRVLDLFEGLDYRINDVPGLRLATRINESLVFTSNGRLPDQYYTDSLLILSVKPVPEDARLEQRFARNQFNKITLLENHNVDRVIEDSLIGLTSIIVEGTGSHRHLGYKVSAIQIMLRTEIGILVAQGFSTVEKQEQDFHMFRTTVSSFSVQN